jgi:glycine cleavage system H protein
VFYTKDHEWIDFQGPVAYVGVSNFRFLGFKAIHDVKLNELSGLIKRGEIVAWIKYFDYQIEVHMPVDGTIVQVNRLFVYKSMGLISEHLAKSGWIVSITPAYPLERNELIPSEEYRTSRTNIFVKNNKLF